MPLTPSMCKKTRAGKGSSQHTVSRYCIHSNNVDMAVTPCKHVILASLRSMQDNSATNSENHQSTRRAVHVLHLLDHYAYFAGKQPNFCNATTARALCKKLFWLSHTVVLGICSGVDDVNRQPLLSETSAVEVRRILPPVHCGTQKHDRSGSSSVRFASRLS